MTVARAELYRYALPLRKPLALHTPGLASRAAYAPREGFVLRFVCVDGREAFGDAADPTVLHAAREFVRSVTNRKLPAQLEEMAAWCGSLPPALGFAVDSALLKLLTPDEPPTGVVPVCALIDDLAHAPELARDAVMQGFRAIKLKVAGEPRVAAQRVRAVSEAVGPDIALRLDANRGWSLEQARAFAEELGATKIAFIEEPVAPVKDLAAFAHGTGLPIALDETIAEGHAEEFAGLAAALVVKPTRVGGIDAALRLGALAKRHNIPLVFSATFESGVGIAALTHWAARWGTPGVAAGLDTLQYFLWDGLDEPLQIAQGGIPSAKANAARPDLARMERLDNA